MGRRLRGVTLSINVTTAMEQSNLELDENVIKKYLKIRSEYLAIINKVQSHYHRKCNLCKIRFSKRFKILKRAYSKTVV